MRTGQKQHHHHDGHSHHAHHHHAPKVNPSNRNKVGLAALLTGLFMIVELVGGYISGSLALIADAGHMFTDFAALSLAWIAFWVSQRPATGKYTFGLSRFSILIAFVNGLTLFLVAAWIVKEAVERFLEPQIILTGPMLYVAIAGLIVNLVVFAILRGADQHNLNIRGAVLHVLGDLLGSVAAIIAALAIMLTGWTPIDPILSILVALIILRSAAHLVKDSAHILLQGSPQGIDTAALTKALVNNIPDIVTIDNFHIWSLTLEQSVVSIEASMLHEADFESVSQAIKVYLFEKYQLDHVNVDMMRCENLPSL